MEPNSTTRINDLFVLADQLAKRVNEDVVQDRCVAFVGAGSTTERSNHSNKRPGLYETILAKSEYPGTSPHLSFPELMEYFCKTQDCGHKNRLIRESISYIEQFSLPGDDHRVAREISRALASIPFFKRFVTTNWDPFLERSLDVLVPTVEDRDLAFWDDRKRQVLKIHGCISRPHSIVATSTDYTECIRSNPLIFNKLKDLMATKTFIFLGYSMRDSDFREVWQSITERLGPFGRPAYAVNPHATPDEIAEWHERGVEIFPTTDTLFLKALRERLEEQGELPSYEFLEFLRNERHRIVEIHIKNKQNSDGGLASAMYQDGLLHELDDVLSSIALGTKKNADFEADRRQAERIVEQADAVGDFIEVAYWTGRFMISDRYCARMASRIPAYLHPDRLLPSTRFVQGDLWSKVPPEGDEKNAIQ